MNDAGRFSAGDVVVLNGHRLTVQSVFRWDDGTEWVDLGAPNGEPLPADWLPNPEDRDDPEPDYPAGSAWQSASGFCYLRRGSQGWVSALGEQVPYEVPECPMTRLVPESGECRPETQPPSDDYRDEWDTFGTKRGVVMASPGEALTPGMTVRDATRPGRVGIVVRPAPYTSDMVVAWRGERGVEAMAPGRLLPVTLVEKPDRGPAVRDIQFALADAGYAPLLSAGEAAYDALFGEPS